MIGFVQMALGSYRFGIANGGYEQLKRRSDWRWAKMDRIGTRPARQFLGPGDDVVTIEGTFFPQHRGGLQQLDRMRAQAGLGQPMNMIDGTGYYWGMYCILSMDEGKTFLMSDGAARKIEFSIELGRY